MSISFANAYVYRGVAPAAAPLSQTRNPVTISQVTTTPPFSNGAAVSWINTGAIAADDGNTARVLINNQYSKAIQSGSFGFAIPLTATIVGIQVGIERRNATGGVTVVQDEVVAVYNNAAWSANGAAAAAWPIPAYAWSYFGGPADLWGLLWTPAVVNSNGFRIGFSCRETSANLAVARVDVAEATVYYTP